MDRVVPWKGLIALIEPEYPKGEGGRPACPLMAMLRVHLMQNWVWLQRSGEGRGNVRNVDLAPVFRSKPEANSG
jgi:hypothetical protein